MKKLDCGIRDFNRNLPNTAIHLLADTQTLRSSDLLIVCIYYRALSGLKNSTGPGPTELEIGPAKRNKGEGPTDQSTWRSDLLSLQSNKFDAKK